MDNFVLLLVVYYKLIVVILLFLIKKMLTQKPQKNKINKKCEKKILKMYNKPREKQVYLIEHMSYL